MNSYYFCINLIDFSGGSRFSKCSLGTFFLRTCTNTCSTKFSTVCARIHVRSGFQCHHIESIGTECEYTVLNIATHTQFIDMEYNVRNINQVV